MSEKPITKSALREAVSEAIMWARLAKDECAPNTNRYQSAKETISSMERLAKEYQV